MVFALDAHKKPLMPCTEKRARQLLERGRAVVHRQFPFTIRLKDRTAEDSAFQNLRLKLDPGSKTTGMAIILDGQNGAKVIFFGEIVHNARRVKGQAEVKRRISEATRQVLRSRPDVLVMEDLSRMRGRTKSRNLSRVVSRWMWSNLKERAEFLSQAGGSRLETANPAYTSQKCPQCGSVHQDNRQGDRFHCRHCHFTAHADTVGATNVKHRDTDSELRERIPVFTPKEGVLKILREIFERKQALSP